MSLSSLSVGEYGLFISINFISLTLLTICVLVNWVQPKHIKHISTTIVVFVLNSLNLAVLLELNRTQWYQTYDQVSHISSLIGALPYYLQYVFLLASIAYVLYEFYSIVLFLRERFSINVVREAIENLPTGLIFYDENGFLFLSNRIMHKLSIELTKKDLQNGFELQHDIDSLQSSEQCVIKGEEPAFTIFDDRIWQFSRSTIVIEGKSYIELRADDITEVYHISDEIRETNRSLKLEKVRLAEHMKNIGNYISEEETLRVKMAVHDDFGELIARTVSAYEREANAEEKGEVILAWSRLSERINRILTFDEVETNRLEKLLSLAEELGCEIEFIGKLPDESICRELILVAAFEFLKNAVYHARVDKIIVTIINEQNKVITTMYNENKTNQTQIIEGGGLTALRDKVEKIGGTMEVICDKGITLCIMLHKEADSYV